MPVIALITFDLDNTLWNVEQVILRAEAHMREWLDEHVPDYGRLLDRTAIITLRGEVLTEHPHLAHDVSALRREVLYRGMLRCGLSDRDARDFAATAFGRFFEARQQVVLFDGALDVLDRLASRYRLGALTNGNADVASIGLDRYFSFALNAADVGASKPAPDMFRAALRRARAAPGEGIHIGDNLVDDIEGANAVGMHSIWVNHNGTVIEAHHSRPTREARALHELDAAVESIRAG